MRLPKGTFVPYAQAKANVLFFTKGKPTKEVWIYDLRTNIPNITKGKPLTEEIFEDFIKCYTQKTRKQTKRFEKRVIKQIEDANFDLDFKFIKDESIKDLDNLPEPDILVKEISKNLKSALDSVIELAGSLKNK